MRVPLNIASRPPDNTRPLRVCALALGLLTLMLAAIAVRSELQSRNEFRSLVDRKSQLESDIRNLEAAEKEMQSWLQTPQVAQIRKRSALLNSLISQKSLSWTRLFQDLESTLPAGVRITSIEPQTSQSQADQGQPELGLTVAAASVAPIVEFIRRLEDSPEFANPVVADQRFSTAKGEEPEVNVSLTARYVQRLNSTSPLSGSSDTGESDDDENGGPQAANRTSRGENMIAAENGRQR
jgi:type IV pilus assembly protein PilN